MQASHIDEVKIKRGLLTFLLVAFTIVSVWFGFSRNQPVFGLLIPLVAMGSFFIGRPAVLLMVVFFVSYARLKIPGLPNALGVLQIFQALLVGWAILDVSIVKQRRFFSFSCRSDIWLIIFGINLVLMMAVRGVGFARTGGMVYGGAEYIAMGLTLVFYFAAVRIEWSDRNVKNLLILLLAGSLIPVFTEFATYFSLGGASVLLKFVQTGTTMNSLVTADETEATKRWGTLSQVAYILIPMAYIFCKKTKWRIVLLTTAFILVGMTGFRSRMVQAGILVFLASVYYSKHRIRAVFFWALAGLVGLGLLMIVAPMLPLQMQRTVSFIPFLHLDSSIVTQAEGSSSWRFDLWRDYCIPNVPKYLLIGRGLSPDISEYAWLQAKWYGSAEFYYHMGRYHSGPFSLLLDFGLLGTVSFTSFFLIAITDAWKTTRRYAAERIDLAARYYVYLTLWLSYEIFSFYFIFGDVSGVFFRLLVLAVQLRILKKIFLMEETVPSKIENQISGILPATGGGKPVNRRAMPMVR